MDLRAYLHEEGILVRNPPGLDEEEECSTAAAAAAAREELCCRTEAAVHRDRLLRVGKLGLTLDPDLDHLGPLEEVLGCRTDRLT